MWYNPLVTWILRSPLHWMMSGNTLLLTYTGRKSGKTFTFPISYGREGQTVWLITQRGKPWLKNISEEGLPVTVRLKGRNFPGQARLVPLERAAALEKMLFVYRGMPHSLAERQMADIAVVAVSLIS